MLNRLLAIGVASLVGWEAPVIAQSRTVDDLTRFSRQEVQRRTGDFIQTPDGRLWDCWGAAEFANCFERSIVTVAIKRHRPVNDLPGFRVTETLGYETELAESTDAQAWKLTEFLRGRQLEGLPRSVWNVEHEGAIPFVYYGVSARDRRQLQSRLIALMGEDSGTSVLQGTTSLIPGLPGSLQWGDIVRGLTPEITMSLGQGLYVVKIGDERCVIRIADKRQAQRGQVRGDFILWPKVFDSLPAGVDEGLPSYEYIPIVDCVVTPNELLAAVDAGKAELVSWEYRSGTWVRETFIPKSKPALPEREENDVERQPKPKIHVSHELRLSDGRIFRGVLVQESESSIQFKVIEGTLVAEMNFDTSQVKEIIKLPS